MSLEENYYDVSITLGVAYVVDGLDFPINIPLSKDESKLIFGKNAAMADDYYQALHYA